MAEIFQPSDKITHFYTILTTNLYDNKARPKYLADLYGTIYIDNIQKAVVICLIIPTTFSFDAGTRVDNVRHTSGYFCYAASSIKRKCCRDD